MIRIEDEGWLHVENRKPAATPKELVQRIVEEHKGVGWHLNEDDAILDRPLFKRQSGCYRVLKMKHNDGRIAILHIKFKKGPADLHTDYKINRTIWHVEN